eukprot:scaffold533_cov369-Prasinococcus_capsulatus_cf.AAC.24
MIWFAWEKCEQRWREELWDPELAKLRNVRTCVEQLLGMSCASGRRPQTGRRCHCCRSTDEKPVLWLGQAHCKRGQECRPSCCWARAWTTPTPTSAQPSWRRAWSTSWLGPRPSRGPVPGCAPPNLLLVGPGVVTVAGGCNPPIVRCILRGAAVGVFAGSRYFSRCFVAALARYGVGMVDEAYYLAMCFLRLHRARSQDDVDQLPALNDEVTTTYQISTSLSEDKELGRDAKLRMKNEVMDTRFLFVAARGLRRRPLTSVRIIRSALAVIAKLELRNLSVASVFVEEANELKPLASPNDIADLPGSNLLQVDAFTTNAFINARFQGHVAKLATVDVLEGALRELLLAELLRVVDKDITSQNHRLCANSRRSFSIAHGAEVLETRLRVPYWLLEVLRQLAGGDFATMLAFGGVAAVDSVAVRGVSAALVEEFFQLREAYERGENDDDTDNNEEYVEEVCEVAAEALAIRRTMSTQTTSSTPRGSNAAQPNRGSSLLRASPSFVDNRASEEPPANRERKSTSARLEEDAEEIQRQQEEIDVRSTLSHTAAPGGQGVEGLTLLLRGRVCAGHAAHDQVRVRPPATGQLHGGGVHRGRPQVSQGYREELQPGDVPGRGGEPAQAGPVRPVQGGGGARGLRDAQRHQLEGPDLPWHAQLHRQAQHDGRGKLPEEALLCLPGPPIRDSFAGRWAAALTTELVRSPGRLRARASG